VIPRTIPAECDFHSTFHQNSFINLAGNCAKIDSYGIPGIDRIPPDSGRNQWRTVKTSGTATTTNKSLDDIFHNFMPPETFMADGGKHFKNWEVADNCEQWGTKLHTVAAYSPWVNGLVEGTNKLLLYILARLCVPEVGEDGWQATTWDKLSTTWPDHFDKVI